MDYGNNGGSEFNWNYSMGGGGAGQNSYPQMGQMGQGSYGGAGGGQQWLHSNQGNTANYQSSMPQGPGSGTPDAFADYNQSMMRYTNLPKSEGKTDMYSSMGQESQGGQSMGMSSMGNSYGGYPGGMSRNGLGNPSAGMGQGGNGGGFGSSW